MSNQPKIVYRSDTTGCLYQMMQGLDVFTIQVVNIDGDTLDESPRYGYIYPWMKTIHEFFAVCEKHINGGGWHNGSV